MAAELDKRLLLVSGKGGVGKSAISAALAVASARAGCRTLVCEVNTQERITKLLGKPEVGPEIARVEPNLWAVNIRPEEAMREYALMTLKFKTVYKAVFENRLVRYFLRFLPSVQELVLLGKIYFHAQEREPNGNYRFDRVIVDAPATGHAITFLSVPQVLVETVPAGPLRTEAEKMRALLIDPVLTAAVLVALPEEMPVNETLELAAALRERLQIRTGAVVLNGYVGERFNQGELATLAALPELAAVVRSHSERERLSAEALAKLVKESGAPVQTVPRIYPEKFGADAINEIAAHVRPLLEAP